MPPYTEQTDDTLDGIFHKLLEEIIPEICGECQRSQNELSSTTIDFDNNGRGTFWKS